MPITDLFNIVLDGALLSVACPGPLVAAFVVVATSLDAARWAVSKLRGAIR